MRFSLARRAIRRCKRPLVRSRGLRLVAGLTGIVAAATVAHAHGPAPAVLGVGAGGVSPSLIRLSVGAAERVGEDWHWVCPATWGGPLAPNMASLGDAALVAGTESLGVYRAGGGFERTSAGLRPDEFVRDSAADVDGVYLVVWNAGEGSRVLRWGASNEVLRDDAVRWASVARLPNGDAFVARVGDDALIVQSLGDAEAAERRFALDTAEATVDLRVVGERLFAVLDGANSRVLELVEDDASLVFESRQLIYGPAPIADDLAVASNGELRTADALGLDIGPAEAWSCMGIADDESTYVCSRLALYAVADGVADEATFEMRELLPPRYDALPPGLVARCTAEWLDYAEHAELIEGEGSGAPVEPVDDVSVTDDAARGGCVTADGTRGTRAGWAWVGLALLAICRPTRASVFDALRSRKRRCGMTRRVAD